MSGLPCCCAGTSVLLAARLVDELSDELGDELMEVNNLELWQSRLPAVAHEHLPTKCSMFAAVPNILSA